jgi:hypothetical protein
MDAFKAAYFENIFIAQIKDFMQLFNSLVRNFLRKISFPFPGHIAKAPTLQVRSKALPW